MGGCGTFFRAGWCAFASDDSIGAAAVANECGANHAAAAVKMYKTAKSKAKLIEANTAWAGALIEVGSCVACQRLPAARFGTRS